MTTPRPTPAFAPDGLPGPGGADPDRFAGIRRDYTPADVARLSGSFRVRHTLAEMGARRLWHMLRTEPFVPTLGALTGMQALQQVKAGLKAIYLSGWQVAADANSAGQMYPDQSLYPVDSVPKVVSRINAALRRADQIATMERADGKADDRTHYMAPIITAVRHQREVGVSYFDAVAMAASGGRSSTTAMAHSTEAAQFHDAPAHAH